MELDALLHALLLRLQGRSRQAAAIYEQMAQFQGEHEGALISSRACFGLGELAYEWNDLDTAERLLEILVLQALAFFAGSEHKAQALPTLERALLLVEEESFI